MDTKIEGDSFFKSKSLLNRKQYSAMVSLFFFSLAAATVARVSSSHLISLCTASRFTCCSDVLGVYSIHIDAYVCTRCYCHSPGFVVYPRRDFPQWRSLYKSGTGKMSTTVRQRLRHRQQLGTHIPTQNPEKKKNISSSKTVRKRSPNKVQSGNWFLSTPFDLNSVSSCQYHHGASTVPPKCKSKEKIPFFFH